MSDTNNLTQKEKDNEISVGETVYVPTDYFYKVEKGQVTSISEDGKIATVKYDTVGSSSELVENLFKSESDALEEFRKRFGEQTELYLKDIKTLEDLILFPVFHNVSFNLDNRDWAAYEAYREKIIEFFGIDVSFLDMIGKGDGSPIIDIEKIVRCKDCKHYHQSTGFCEENSYFYDDEGLSCSPAESPNWTMFSDDDFCSYGERRNEAEDI